jgi:hypothetical protein
MSPRRALLSVACLALAVAGLSLPAAASADVEIGTFSSLPSGTEAGGHPNLLTQFTLSSHQTNPTACSCNDAKDITVHLPTGLIGNPHATPQCNIAQFASSRCPVDSQVGAAVFSVSTSIGAGNFEGQQFLAPVYNMVPPPEQPGLLAFKSGAGLETPTFENVGARTDSDYGLDIRTASIEHFAPLTGFEQLTWGVPASPGNDNFRFGFGQIPVFLLSFLGSHEAVFCDAEGNLSTNDPSSIVKLCYNFGLPLDGHSVGEWGNVSTEKEYEEFSGNVAEYGKTHHPIPSNSPETPFLQAPTTCGLTYLTSVLEVLAYDGETTYSSSSWPATTACSLLGFNPSQSITPTTEAADSPSGAEFRLTVPQFESPSVPSPSELKAAVVTLPAGFSFAPNVTNGKTTCSDSEAKFGTTLAAKCPENSKVGTVSVETPVLPGPLPGAVYLGEPKPGNRFRVFLVFDGFGVHVKLPGVATPDPTTGQIVFSFQNLPQAPFSFFNAHFFGSERGPLETPEQCGIYEVTSEWTPWDAALSNQISRQFFNVTEGPDGKPCPNGRRPFGPNFKAASRATTGGAHTDFSLNVLREDGEQNLESLSITTPPGFSATLKDVSYCPQASIEAAEAAGALGATQLVAPSCPASSQVGELVAGAGPGSHPLYLPGKAYLAGPYKGAPLSFVFITPTVSGGYDLGNVVVRAALYVNPETAQVTAVSDSLPQIFEGIPLRLRQILVNLNRPSFALNPTNCSPLSVGAQVFGDEGALSTLRNHFQVSNCSSLPFAPKLAFRLSGSTKQAGNPALTALLTAKPGEANISRTRVTLPSTELIDNAHINNLCTRVRFAEGHDPGEKCPSGSRLGFARVETPLLAKPLEGPIYLRSTGRAGLPDVVAALNGQIDIALDGHVDSVRGSLRTTFESVPDAPITKAVLRFDGGHKGLLENSPGVCSHPLHVSAAITGQNGKTANQSPILATPCGKHRKRAHPTRAGHARAGRR